MGIGVEFLGAAAGMVTPAPNSALVVWYGIASGLGASGLYSGLRAMFAK